MLKNFVLTGAPGCGKTTLLTRLLTRLETLEAGGFTTEEILENDERVGFRLRTIEGDSAIIAHVEYDKHPAHGRYGVQPGMIKHFANRAVRRALTHDRLIVIDEIGPIQLTAPGFAKTVLRALGSKRVVLATVPEKDDEFIATIKRRPDVRLLRMTTDNRESLLDEVIRNLKALLPL